MPKLFLDANVLFAATISSSGGSAYIFELARRHKVRLFSSSLALKEAERNLREKTDEEAVLRFYDLLEDVDIRLFSVDRKKAKKNFAKLVGEKDAPILGAAISAEVDFLITLDKKHFLNQKIFKTNLLIKILTPGQFIEKFL